MKYLLLLFAVFFSIDDIAAQQYFNPFSASQLVTQNKQNYNDHNDMMNNQFLSALTIRKVNSGTTTMKALSDKLELRMTQIFTILADVNTAYNIYNSLLKVYDAQAKAVSLLVEQPLLTPWVVGYEKTIISSAEDLYFFIYAIVFSYGDFNKITVADRKEIYNNLDHYLSKIVINANAMVYELQGMSLAGRVKNSLPGQYINSDAKIATGIIKSFKF